MILIDKGMLFKDNLESDRLIDLIASIIFYLDNLWTLLISCVHVANPSHSFYVIIHRLSILY